VPAHPVEARAALARCAAALEAHGRRAVVGRARHLAALSRAPAQAIARHRVALHQRLKELRAASRRRVVDDRERVARRALVLERKAGAAAGPQGRARRAALDSLAAALAAHDPERTLARGYAIVDDGAGGIVTSAARARELGDVRLFFGDGPVDATINDNDEKDS
jgi:exodeoxyribonuclease VII large subunit